MNRVNVLVEGQTEEVFIRDVLAPALWSAGVTVTATVVTTKRSLIGGKFKGGAPKYQRVATQVRGLLRDSGARLVTTMLDLYRLPADFPGARSCPVGSGRTKAAHLERSFAEDIADSRFRPYLSVHEFEALLFSDLEACAGVFGDRPAIERLQAQRVTFPTAEDVNDGQDTSPSRRIEEAFPGYDKPRHGPIATGRIGLARLREQCPHFNAWVRDLEQAGTTPPHSSTG